MPASAPTRLRAATVFNTVNWNKLTHGHRPSAARMSGQKSARDRAATARQSTRA